MENRGVAITGGTVSAGAIAGGDHATAINEAVPAEQPTLADLRAALRHLREVVESGATALEDPEPTVTVARLAEQEGAKTAPNKGSLSGFLQVLTSGAGAISGLAGAVTAVETALQALL